ncbi:MAG TPA: hypothetical protein VHV47_03595 [Opitutaceae bacterium]|jgi:hypothetical protein|nr:hypothetical protein [Opitutaceae bacterium]
MKHSGKTHKIEPPVFDAEGYQINIKDLNGEPLPDLNDGTPFVPLYRHGGRRRGAGRKPAGRQPILLRLNPEVIRILRAAARRRQKSLSAVAEEALRKL